MAVGTFIFCRELIWLINENRDYLEKVKIKTNSAAEEKEIFYKFPGKHSLKVVTKTLEASAYIDTYLAGITPCTKAKSHHSDDLSLQHFEC